MASEQVDPNLTSYLKSMFVQYNGEERPASPPSPSAHSPPVPAARNSKASLSEDLNIETDLNNNEQHEHSSSPTSPPTPPPSQITNGASSIKVDVIVHNDATNSVTNRELNESHNKDIANHDDSLANSEQHHSPPPPFEHTQPIINGNRIALSFLDELKQTLQTNKPLDESEETTTAAPEEPGHKELRQADKSSGTESVEQQADNGSQVQRHAAEAVAPPEPAHNPYTSSTQDEEANGEVSEVESGIGIDDQSSVASESNTTLQNGHAGGYASGPVEPARNVLTRSTSSDQMANGTRRPPVMRTVSQDVKFKLESIKEEKKVTKTRVSSLASFWKDKMISPKEKK